MKAAIVKSMIMALITVAMVGCAEDAATNEDPLQFNFKLSSTDQSLNDLPPDASLLISMESPTGEPLYTLENIAYTKTKEGFSTTGLDVDPGDYRVTEFMLVDSHGEILYTIPYEDSPLTQSVVKPLGFDVHVVPGNADKIKAEVLGVSKHNPSDFGLASFKTNNSFQLVVSEKGAADKAVTAAVAIMKDDQVVASFNVPAKKSRISFDGDVNATYKLIVSRDACAPYVTEFTLADWRNTYKHKPLKVALDPAFTMVAQGFPSTDYPFYFYIGAESANLTINWGDGTTEARTIVDASGEEVSHAYAAAGDYAITITGDLDKIEYFYSFYGGSPFSAIHFRHLVNLEEIRFGLTSCPAVVDLSHNSNLKSAMLLGLLDLEQLILPASHDITFLEIDGENKMNTAAVDAVINNIYTNVSTRGTTNGILGLSAHWAQEEGDMSMVGPPSDGSLVLIESLRNDYGWYVRPGPSGGRLKSGGKVSARRSI